MDFDDSRALLDALPAGQLDPATLAFLLRIAAVFLVLFASQAAFAAVLPPPPPAKVTLGWTPSPSSGVTGYNVYVGTSPRSYTQAVNAGPSTNCVITNLTRGVTYYFSATALDQYGLESDFSQEVSYMPPVNIQPQMTLTAATGSMTLSSTTSAPGYVYNVLATEDMQNWTTLATITANSNGQLQYTDSTASKFKKRFYKLQQISP